MSNENNVISIFSKKRAGGVQVTRDAASEETFKDTMLRNQEAQERLRQERLKANQSVLRSYRLKKRTES